MTHPIEAVCFDLGKVLLHFDWSIAIERICRKSPLTPDGVRQITAADPDIIAYEIGAIPTEVFFQHQKQSLQFDGTPEELQQIWTEIFTPLEKHVEIARKVAATYKVAIISNTNAAHIGYAEAQYSFFEIFPIRIYSHQVGVMKPRREIYEAALQRLNTSATRCLFLDDLAENLEGAAQVGFRTIHITPEIDLVAALREQGVQL